MTSSRAALVPGDYGTTEFCNKLNEWVDRSHGAATSLVHCEADKELFLAKSPLWGCDRQDQIPDRDNPFCALHAPVRGGYPLHTSALGAIQLSCSPAIMGAHKLYDMSVPA